MVELCCAARDNMLMRYAKVSPNGAYTPPPAENSKASYSTMVYVRATIVEDAGWHLARAATISVSRSPPGSPPLPLRPHRSPMTTPHRPSRSRSCFPPMPAITFLMFCALWLVISE